MDAGDSTGMLLSSTTHLPPTLDKAFALASATTRFLVEYSSGVTTNVMINGTAVVSKTGEDELVFHTIVQQMFRHDVNKIRSGVPVKRNGDFVDIACSLSCQESSKVRSQQAHRVQASCL